jgi:hypothetical protein
VLQQDDDRTSHGAGWPAEKTIQTDQHAEWNLSFSCHDRVKSLTRHGVSANRCYVKTWRKFGQLMRPYPNANLFSSRSGATALIRTGPPPLSSGPRFARMVLSLISFPMLFSLYGSATEKRIAATFHGSAAFCTTHADQSAAASSAPAFLLPNKRRSIIGCWVHRASEIRKTY